MKLITIIIMLVLAIALMAEIDTRLIREFGKTSNEEKQLLIPDIAKSIVVDREVYPLFVLYEDWEEGDWVYDMKDTHSYDENGYPNEILMQDWENGDWLNYMKMCFNCDEEGLTQESTMHIWEPTTNEWIEMFLMTYTYDGNGNWIEILSQMWVYDVYIYSSRITRQYNNLNQPVFETDELWDYGGSWINNSQTTFSYADEFLLEKLEESWEYDSYWENSLRTSYTQQSGIHPATRLHQSWNGGGYWDNQRHSDYTYDGDWHEIEDYEQVWEAGDWVNFQTHYYSYEGDNLMERLTKEWDPLESWLNHSRYTVQYGTLQSQDYEIVAVDFKLSNYPNPFNPSTTISFALNTEITESTEVEIYNLKGQKIVTLSDPVQSDNIEGLQVYYVTWNGRDGMDRPVPSGIYYYKIRIGRLEQIKKMILMK